MRVGDYTIERELSPDVYEATHVLLPRRVILRVVGPEREGAVRTMREACILEALRHPGVPRIYECGRTADRTWIAVEHISGAPVAMPSIEELIAIVRDVASILDHAHLRGVSHGDVRRESIIVRSKGACLVGWHHARLARDYAEDVRALGELACSLLAGPAPAAFRELLGDMRASDPADRPTAGEVASIATRLVAEVIELDIVDLVEIELPPPVSYPTPVPLRWTPAQGVRPIAPAPGIAIGHIKLRS
jgi:hypothetical protein